jgi:release factor glutamine methyltransferase
VIEDGDKVLDMCTGSGCIAISIAKHCKDKHITVTAADVSDAAIMLAKENANYNSVDVNFVQTDLFSKVHGRFNVIVCNPPYIKSKDIAKLQKEVKNYEPRIALDGGEDGLDFYRRLAKEISRYIVRGGMLILEVGENQAEDVLKLFEKRDYAMVVKDFAGVDRILKIAF